LEAKRERYGRNGALKGDTAGTAGIAVINYFEGKLNPKSYRLVIDLAGGFPQICGCKFMPGINLARAAVVGSGDGSFSRSMGKFKRALAEEPALGQVQHQKKRQNKQKRLLNDGPRPLPGLIFLPGIYLRHMHKLLSINYMR
jgi:hypothetical protein